MLGFRVMKRMVLPIVVAALLSLGTFNSSAHAQADDPVALMKQILSLTREGKFDEAIEAQKRVMAAIGKMAGKEHPLYLMQIAGLGDLYGMKGDSAQAERYHSEALALREKFLGREHADVASSLASLANAYTNLARFDEAEATLGRALAIRKKVLPESSPDYGFTYVHFGRVYMFRSRFADAERAFQQARASSPATCRPITNFCRWRRTILRKRIGRSAISPRRSACCGKPWQRRSACTASILCSPRR